MEWEKEGINYWENPECPTEYLQEALVRLVYDVEGVDLPGDYFNDVSREQLIREVGFLEYVADK